MSPTVPVGQWADEPLDDRATDLLGRDAFVRTVAQRIDRALVTDPSVVFGLVGPWGSGKTSVLNRIRASLSDDWVIADFTPWSTGDPAAISLEFVSTLARVLDVKVKGSTRQLLARYAGYGSSLLGLVPIVGGGITGAAEKVLGRLADRAPWHVEFNALSAEVAKVGKRVLFVVDDVDRLGDDELMALLRVVRLLGRFTGVHYLIAYDQVTVEDLLASQGVTGRSTTFMEKIVQHPFEVPPISRATSVRLINEAITELLADTGLALDDLGLQRLTELVGVLAPLVDTPRRYGRFGEQLRSFAQHVIDAELDPLDYAAVTWLRLNAHGIWMQLTNWREELHRGTRSVDVLTSTDITPEEWTTSIRGAQPDAEPSAIVRLLSFLFPGIESRGMSSYIAHPRPLAEEEYFPRYMLLALPEDDVSDRLIVEVLEAEDDGTTSEREPELTAILDGPDPDLAYLGYLRAERNRRGASTAGPGLIRYLAARLAARRDEEPGVGVPLNALRPWLAREVALALSVGSVSAREVIELFGEDESQSLIFAITRLPDFRQKGKEVASGFADYWLDVIHERLDEFIASTKLGGVIDLIVYARGPEQVRGLLDASVTDFDQYMRIAEAFVTFRQWVGSSTSYEIEFRSTLFAAVVSPEVRARFADDVRRMRTDIDFETDDLPAPIVSDAARRDYVISALAELDDL